MPDTIATYLAESNDDYSPLFSKPSLQQYDNYQIYDIYCTDIVYTKVKTNEPTTQITESFKSWIAVQAYNPELIQCDFNAIANTYK